MSAVMMSARPLVILIVLAILGLPISVSIYRRA
jgi:hypothetical protein